MIKKIYNKPLLNLIHEAAIVHRQNFNPRYIQQSTLMSIKTGGCSENCGYCSQSQHHSTSVKATRFANLDDIIENAKRAKENGSSRFCMGAAWKGVGKKHAFKKVLHAVKEISAMGMEVCTTLGSLTEAQAHELKEAGLTAYNHNLDTSRSFYPKVVTTRTYDERLETIKHAQTAGLSVCSGGILGLGESDDDRIELIEQWVSNTPDSIPINALVPIKGTPIGDKMEFKAVTWDDMVRMIATTRIVCPKSYVRLSAGRIQFSEAEQGLMFLSGANSIFSGDVLLTAPNNDIGKDAQMFSKLGLSHKNI